MALFNHATKEVTAKLVYYGPGLCGKTTNLQWIHENLSFKSKGKLVSLATQTDRTLFFDFLPVELGTIRGMRTRLQLYTVPGQVFYESTRRMVLKGCDAVVFVADSQAAMLDANAESQRSLRQNLLANEIDPTIPQVLQYNKRDLPTALPISVLNARLNPRNLPWFEAVAFKGTGVEETLKGVSKLLFQWLAQHYGASDAEAALAGIGSREAKPDQPAARVSIKVSHAELLSSPSAPSQPAAPPPSPPAARSPEPPPDRAAERPGTVPPSRPGTAPPSHPGTAPPSRPGTAPPSRPGTAPPSHPGTSRLPGPATPPPRPVTVPPQPATPPQAARPAEPPRERPTEPMAILDEDDLPATFVFAKQKPTAAPPRPPRPPLVVAKPEEPAPGPAEEPLGIIEEEDVPETIVFAKQRPTPPAEPAPRPATSPEPVARPQPTQPPPAPVARPEPAQPPPAPVVRPKPAAAAPPPVEPAASTIVIQPQPVVVPGAPAKPAAPGMSVPPPIPSGARFEAPKPIAPEAAVFRAEQTRKPEKPAPPAEPAPRGDGLRADQWLYLLDGAQRGPVDVEDLIDLVLTSIPENTKVWHPGLETWIKANQVRQIADEIPPPIPVPGAPRAGYVEEDMPDFNTVPPMLRTVLIADEDAAFRKYLAMPLAAQGFTIYEAADGSAAWQLAVQNRPWMILADVSMPELDGFEFCRRVRTHPLLSRMPLLFISESDKYKERYRALQIGADDFLSKNMPVRELLMRIQLLMTRYSDLSSSGDPKAGATEMAGVFQGRIEVFGAPPLLQMCAQGRLTGLFTALAEDAANTATVMGFRDGDIISATVGATSGPEAVYTFLGWEKGSFKFTPGDPGAGEPLAQSVEHLLLEGCRLLDESRKEGDGSTFA
jgi:CheY-like chemotaxis protein